MLSPPVAARLSPATILTAPAPCLLEDPLSSTKLPPLAPPPAAMETLPPCFDRLEPADTDTDAPISTPLDPATTETLPAEDDSLLPLPTNTKPESKTSELPDETKTDPLLPSTACVTNLAPEPPTIPTRPA